MRFIASWRSRVSPSAGSSGMPKLPLVPMPGPAAGAPPGVNWLNAEPHIDVNCCCSCVTPFMNSRELAVGSGCAADFASTSHSERVAPMYCS